MNKNLLILGAGLCGMSAREIARHIGCFEKINFLDDNITEMPDGTKILGTLNDFENFANEYSNIFVAIANPKIKLNLLNKIKETTPYRIVTLISPNAYISPSAQIMQGSMIEAMAVINTGSVISTGCIIGAGSIVNHSSMCCDGVHMECRATVADNTLVPAGAEIKSGEIFKRNTIEVGDLFFDTEKSPGNADNAKKPHGPLPVNGLDYCFEDGM